MSTELLSQVSPSLRPEVITSIKGYEAHKIFTGTVDEVFAFTYEAVKTLANTVEELRHDELKTTKAKTQALAKNSDAYLKQIMDKFSFHAKLLDESVNLIHEQLAAPLEKEAEGGLSTEIRSHIKTLQPEDRRAMMNEATQSGDAATCAAVLCAPPYLSGISEVEHKNYLSQYHKAGNPEIVERLEVLAKVKEVIERTRPIAQREIDGLSAKLLHKIEADKSREEFMQNSDRSHPAPTGIG